MATSVIFDLIPALVEQLQAAMPDGVTVYHGYGASDEPGDFLMVGVDDPNSDDFLAPSAESTQEWAGLGARHRDETGTLTCVALSWTGNPEATNEALANLRVIAAAVEAHITADPNLGGAVPGLLWVRPEGTARLMQGDGQALYVFALSYTARL